MKPLPVIPWYSSGLQFTCTECGNCCTGGPGYVWISPDEIDRLAKHLKLSRKETLQAYCRRIGGRISLKETRTPQDNYDCIFLREIPPTPAERRRGQRLPKRICSIYSVRPLQCRTWPFWHGNLYDKEAWNRAATRCPGLNTGRHYTQQQIEHLRDTPDWPDNPPTSADPKNP